LEGYAIFTFDKFKILVSNVPGVVVGDVKKDSQNLLDPSNNKLKP
jgi:hypothetical protein